MTPADFTLTLAGTFWTGEGTDLVSRLISALIGLLLCAPGAARADHQDLTLFASPALVEIGFLAFLLPRFSLKTGVKIHVQPLAVGATIPAGADVVLGTATGAGRLAMRGLGQDFAVLQIAPQDHPATRFTDWLLSEIGQRTVAQFTDNGAQVFTGAASAGPQVTAAPLSGNASRGEILSYSNCGRCHVIGARNRMNGIGSTPSFAVLRSFADWKHRFLSFYALNPHPSFSQVTGVTAPFDEALPPPISPLVLTLDQLDDIIAFTDTIEPADLGAPLVHQ